MAKLTENEIKEIVKERGYELLKVERKNKRTYVTIKCNKGHITTKIWQGTKAVFGCKECKRENSMIWNKETIIEFIENEDYEVVEFLNENGLTSRIKVWCKNPNHKPYEVQFGNFKGNSSKKGTRCEKCKRSKWDKDEIIRFVNNEEGYEFIEFIKFDKVKSRIKIKCPKSHIYEVTFRKFQEGRRCPICKESKGEKVIEEILKEFNIGYVRQHRFDDCKFKYRLPFDFYLTDYNVCIEFDGRQHFEIVGTFGGFDSFIDTIIRDTVKNEYCKKNNIKLIRIPYWDMENIEKIIVNELE